MNDMAETSKNGTRALLAKGLLVAAVVGLMAGLTVANYRFAETNPGGNDFIPRWLGTQMLLDDGQNPYGEQTTMTIQQFIYGRPALPNEDQVLFVYPLYSAALFAPFALVGDYVLARALWMTALEVALIGLALVSIRLAEWRPSLSVLTMVLLFGLVWYHSVRPLINGNASILVSLFIALALYLIYTGHDVAAGALLALSTIKPQAIILLLPLLLAWAFSRRRYRIIVSTLASLAALFLLAAAFEPSWLSQNINQIVAYPSYTEAGTPGAIFEHWYPAGGRWPGIALTILLAGLLFWQWKVAWGQDFNVLLPVAFFTLAATNLIGVTTAASNYIALFPALVLLFAYWRREQSSFGDWPAVVAMIFLLAGLWYLFWTSRAGRAQSPIMLFPLPLILILTMPFLTRSAARAKPVA